MSDVAKWKPTAPQGDSVDDLELKEWVGQALGAASSCWENVGGAGEFDSTRCGWIFDGLMERLGQVERDRKTLHAARKAMEDSRSTYERLSAEADARMDRWDAMYARHRRVALPFLPIYIFMLAFALIGVLRVNHAGLHSTAIALIGCFAFFVASAWVPAAVLWRREKRAR